MYWCFYVTFNDISVIYVTAQMCRRTEEDVVPEVGSNAVDNSLGSLACPSKHRHGTNFFIWLLVFRETDSISRLLRHAGDTEDLFST